MYLFLALRRNNLFLFSGNELFNRNASDGGRLSGGCTFALSCNQKFQVSITNGQCLCLQFLLLFYRFFIMIIAQNGSLHVGVVMLAIKNTRVQEWNTFLVTIEYCGRSYVCEFQCGHRYFIYLFILVLLSSKLLFTFDLIIVPMKINVYHFLTI